MEDKLKILKGECLINTWSDLPQILNLSSEDQTKIKNAWNEDELHWKKTWEISKSNFSATTDQIFLIF